jgi:hypothetical protein
MIVFRVIGAVLFLFASFASLSAAAPVPESDKDMLLRKPYKIAAFYNMFAQGPNFNAIVKNQVDVIKDSGLLEKLDVIFYATMGNAGFDYTIQDEKYTHITHYGDSGEEIQTLSLLYKFCNANPDSKVLYFHDKGSFHQSYFNAKFCSLLNCYVLNPNCIDALDEHDTCGWRISPTPHIHYSGNFWWARCQYINKLVDPLMSVNNRTFLEGIPSFPCSGVDGRYFAESWIGTAPTIYPADCMNSSIDATYVWGYNFPVAADAFCQDRAHSGLPCQTASTFTNVKDFKHAINHMNSLIPREDCKDGKDELVRLSQFMYGEDPHTYLEWMGRLHEAEVFPELSAIRFTDSTQVYQVQGGVLRGIPNLGTFIKLGLDFDDVKVLYASDRPGYRFGPMLDSM